jgi:hypothetical protein
MTTKTYIGEVHIPVILTVIKKAAKNRVVVLELQGHNLET